MTSSGGSSGDYMNCQYSTQHIANTDISLNLPPWPQVTVYMELMWWEVNRNLTVDFPMI